MGMTKRREEILKRNLMWHIDHEHEDYKMHGERILDISRRLGI
jgi:hypothetical protein